MKALLLTLMFLISMTAFSQQKYGREDGITVLKDSSIVVIKDSLMSPQPIIIDHHALAKKYKRKSIYYGIAAVAFCGVGVGCYCYALSNYNLIDMSNFHWGLDSNAKVKTRNSGSGGSNINSKYDNVMIFGTVCFAAAIGCTIEAIVCHHKAGKELKLSMKGTTASLVYTF